MSNPFLSQTEILEIVAPLKRCDAICRWFSNAGYSFKVRPNGMPLVSRSHFEHVTSGASSVLSVDDPATGFSVEPDSVALVKHLRRNVAN